MTAVAMTIAAIAAAMGAALHGTVADHRENLYETRDLLNSRLDFKIKHDNIGLFNPFFNDPDDMGVVQDGKTLVYTDVHRFVDRIKTFTEEDYTG
ncbi:hypothetical protein VTK56DRAFT_4696 [Thermocarpiscus australiensis]